MVLGKQELPLLCIAIYIYVKIWGGGGTAVLACMYLYLTCKTKNIVFLGGGGGDWLKHHCICTHEEGPRGVTIQKWNWLGWVGKGWPKGEHLGG